MRELTYAWTYSLPVRFDSKLILGSMATTCLNMLTLCISTYYLQYCDTHGPWKRSIGFMSSAELSTEGPMADCEAQLFRQGFSLMKMIRILDQRND